MIWRKLLGTSAPRLIAHVSPPSCIFSVSQMENYYLWIEAEQWAPGEWDPSDCNSDVMVSFEKDGEWVATFFTYKNLLTLAKKNESTGECLNGKYFWAADMILVDELSRERVEEVVSHLISQGEFENVFRVGDV